MYRLLQAEASRLRITPEKLLERLLTGTGDDGISSAGEPEERDEQEQPVPPPGSPAALAAVQRLTSLFADINLPDLESLLADPALTLANADLADVQS